MPRHLEELFRRLAREEESAREEGHLTPDDAHMLIAIPPRYPVAQVAAYLKG